LSTSSCCCPRAFLPCIFALDRNSLWFARLTSLPGSTEQAVTRFLAVFFYLNLRKLVLPSVDFAGIFLPLLRGQSSMLPHSVCFAVLIGCAAFETIVLMAWAPCVFTAQLVGFAFERLFLSDHDQSPLQLGPFEVLVLFVRFLTRAIRMNVNFVATHGVSLVLRD
jgi:hypothetical protein